MRWDAVFFDFDGVVLDSVHIKAEAFAGMFRPFGEEIASKVVDYHLSHGGVSRFDKIRFWYENFLKQPVDDKKVEELCEQFSRLVFEKVIASPFIDGALDALESAKTLNIPAYVVTGTPHNEIQHIVKSKGIEDYFDEVHGSPGQKDEIIKDILQRKGYLPQNCLFIGDGLTDYKAASKLGLHFLGIVKPGAKSPFPEGTTVSGKVHI